nr:hypothetical protein [Anaerolineae bacterium]
MTARHYVLPVVFALLACAISLTHTARTRQNFTFQPGNELDYYPGYALNLLAGYGYRDCIPTADLLCQRTADDQPEFWNQAYRLPGYPLFLTGVLLFTGTERIIPPILLLQSVLLALVVLLTVALAGRYYGDGAALVAGGLLLINGALFYLASLVMTEIFFTFLLLLFVWGFLHARRGPALLLTGILL